MSWAVNLAEMEARRAKDDEAMANLRTAYANSPGWNWYLPLAEFPPLTGKYGSYFFDWLAHPGGGVRRAGRACFALRDGR
jgi:hypothetical protein